jgi:DNA-binding transcriptional regulator YdaS (Cro superfamily)
MFAVCKHEGMENLSSYLKRTGIKQSDFAAIIGVSRSYLSLILSGKRGVDLNLAFTIERQTNGEVLARSFASIEHGDAVTPLHPPHSEQSVSETCPNTATGILTAAR